LLFAASKSVLFWNYLTLSLLLFPFLLLFDISLEFVSDGDANKLVLPTESRSTLTTGICAFSGYSFTP